MPEGQEGVEAEQRVEKEDKDANVKAPTPIPGSDENPDRKKFKPPPNIAKADAKDPAYETLQGIGNELFNVAKAESKSKSKKVVQAAAEKDKFKQPPKVEFCTAAIIPTDQLEHSFFLQIQKADAKDPQYETLADVKDDIFKRQ
ncbi:unnamed protein product [Cylicostephanus goldi]|uniref:Uncharacterized protein n=1 Tax=Cylicostephanus goldi TaxID=71465 RepID=A0A3P6U609_CYLGO|nr:unnamed protein product [Cylicostephanus goldi]